MNKMMYNSYLMIDKKKIKQNIQSILEQLPESVQLIPVLKCNAYGLGIEEVAQIMQPVRKIKMFAVAQILEAMQIRKRDTQRDILILGAVTDKEQYRAALEYHFTLTAYRPGWISEAAQTARTYKKKLKVHIKINSGLNRLGVKTGTEIAQMIKEINDAKDVVQITGAFSHFSELLSNGCGTACREAEIFLQGVRQFEQAGIPIPFKHLCASASWEIHPEFSLDAVRIGRRLYYDHPTRPKGDVQEAVSWRARILDIQLRKKGEKIGYGGEICLEQDTKIALAGVGYGDGLNLALTHKHPPVLVRGKRARLLACCMDQCFIDVQDIDCSIGDEITFFGYDEKNRILPGSEIASLIDDEACSLTSALGPRVLRIYQ